MILSNYSNFIKFWSLPVINILLASKFSIHCVCFFYISRKCRSLLKQHILLFLEMPIYASVSMEIDSRLKYKLDKLLVANLTCWNESHLIKYLTSFYSILHFSKLHKKWWFWKTLLQHQWQSGSGWKCSYQVQSPYPSKKRNFYLKNFL